MSANPDHTSGETPRRCSIDRGPRRPSRALRRGAAAGRAGGPRADHRHDRRDRRPLRRQPRHLRADHGAARAARLAARQDPLGRRPSGLSAQGAHRPPRPARDDPPVRAAWRRSARCSSPSTTSWAPATRRPRSATRSGSRRRCARDRRGRQGRRGDRRRRADRRRRVRGAPQRRRPADADRDRPQRQRDVDLAERRRDRALVPAPARCNPRLYHAREDVESRADQAAARARPPDRAARARDQGGDQGLRRAGSVLRGARPRVHGPDRRPRRRRAARATLEAALDADRPVVVHIHTVKGKGFEPAEEGGLEGMEKWHAAKPGSIVERQAGAEEAAAKPPLTRGEMIGGRPAGGGRRSRRPPYTSVFGDALVVEAKRDKRVIGITAAMAGGTGLTALEKRVPGAVLRRRDRRAGRGPVRRRARDPGGEAGLRDLLDLPAARLRPDRPRRLPAEAQRRLRDGPRRARRRRRADPPRRLRRLLLPRAAERRRDGAARRGDALPHAAHRARLRRRADRASATRAAPPRACRCPIAPARSRSAPARC